MSRNDEIRRAFRYRYGEPVFSEQWHAQATAVVDLLITEGRIDADDWSRTLGAELDKGSPEKSADTDEQYYTAFLGALEKILDRHRVVLPAEVDKRESDWREAYLNTPHGSPVALKEQPATGKTPRSRRTEATKRHPI